ncbi:MAG: hypothetical protein KBD41_15905 [Saprospiraceae bacterium]|nr:hypothetical protein [Saprospiraceae bacterium]
MLFEPLSLTRKTSGSNAVAADGAFEVASCLAGRHFILFLKMNFHAGIVRINAKYISQSSIVLCSVYHGE